MRDLQYLETPAVQNFVLSPTVTSMPFFPNDLTIANAADFAPSRTNTLIFSFVSPVAPFPKHFYKFQIQLLGGKEYI